MAKDLVFSGMQPSGRFHLGNYLGALDNWLQLQQRYDCIFAVVDWHALTSKFERSDVIPDNIREMVIDWLSAGLDPEKNILFVQSHVKEHAELHLLLSMITPLGWLERVPTYKDKIQQLGQQGNDINTYGFMGYPVLMTADIALYKANMVPVGEDQLPHLELAREIVRRFNYLYGNVLVEPKDLLSQAPTLPGIDGRKMSKSYGNEISFSASPDEIRSKTREMVTDPQRIRKSDPGHPDVCAVYRFHKLFSSADEVQQITADCCGACIGCVQCKKQLADRMIAKLEPVRQKRVELEQRPEYISELLRYGAERATKIARQTMEEVRTAMHV